MDQHPAEGTHAHHDILDTAPLVATPPGAGASRTGATPAIEKIGPYKVLRRLGAGGMGDVYLGVREDSQFASRVAIKRVRKGMDSEQILQRFQTERRILAALNHPYIGRLVDGGMAEDGSPYLVMEYIEGMPIDEFCDRYRLPIEERLRLFSRVCEAVHYAHQNLIVHRDLKPANILVTREGVPKLLDFGIAKLLNPDLAQIEHSPTLTQFRLMTPEYASPEQVRGDPLTTCSDIYALGVILFELLTGHRPYQLSSRTQHEIERVICEQDPDRPSTAVSRVEDRVTRSEGGQVTTRKITPESVSHARDGRPERLRRRLSGDLDNIVLMAMRKEPQRRYASAEEFARDIERHLDGMPVIARPDTIGYRAAKFVRRNRASVAGASFVSVALVVGMAGTTHMAQVAQGERDRTEQALREVEAQRAVAESRAGMLQQLSRDMLEFYDQVDTRPGAIEAGRFLVGRAIENLQALGDEARDDPVLGVELANAYDHIGELQGGRRHANQGDLEGALRSFTTAHELYARHAGASVRAAIGFAKSHIKIGDIHERKGERTEALQRFVQAQEAAEGVVRDHPENSDAQRTLASAMLARADMLWHAGQRAAANELYDSSVRIRERLREQRPDDAINARDLAVGLARVGRSLAATGDTSGALDAYQRSKDIRRDLRDRMPAMDVRARRDLLVIDLALADIYGMRGQHEEQIVILDEARASMLDLVRQDPENARAKRDLAATIERLGDAQAGLGRLSDARDTFRELRDATRRFREVAPNDANGLRLEVGGALRLAEVFAALGNADAAEPHLNDAQRLLDDGPQPLDPQRLTVRATLERARAVMHESQGRARDAAALYAQAVRTYAELPAESRADAWTRFAVADLRQRRAETVRDTDLREAQREMDLAAGEFESLGDVARPAFLAARAHALDLERQRGVQPADRAARDIAALLADEPDPPAEALRALARSQHAAGQKGDAVASVDRAIATLEARPVEGWAYTKLLAALRAERALYAAP